MRKTFWPLLVALHCLSGCSTSPIPHDVIGLSVFDLVQKIQCEARDTVVREFRKERLHEKQPEFEKLLSKIKNVTAENAKALGPRIKILEKERSLLTVDERLIAAQVTDHREFLEEVVRAYRKKFPLPPEDGDATPRKPGKLTDREQELIELKDGAVLARLNQLSIWIGRQDDLPSRIREFNRRSLSLARSNLLFERKLEPLREELETYSDLQRFYVHTFTRSNERESVRCAFRLRLKSLTLPPEGTRS